MRAWRANVLRALRALGLRVKHMFRPMPPSRFDQPRGFLTPDQLAEAQRVQALNRKPFDEVLIDLGIVGKREVMQANAQGLGIPFVDLERIVAEAEALRSIPSEMAHRLKALPIKRSRTQLWVAMDNPLDIKAIDELNTVSKCRIIPVVVVRTDLRVALDQSYPSE